MPGTMESKATIKADTLRANLAYEPEILRFGTSGRRGEVVHLTQLEIYLNASAELEYLQSIHSSQGGIVRGDPFFYAYDLRPSSTRFVAAERSRGELAQAIERAILDAGMQPVNLGPLPTPALAYYALGRGKGSIMVTGSHIPFERNGYKTNTSRGELLKQDEGPITLRVEQVRARLYAQAYAESLFDRQGCFKMGHRELGAEIALGREAYLKRYLDFFAGQSLAGKRFLVYQHSAVGRDLLVEILERLGAKVVSAGRSEVFVPIDTENIDHDQLVKIQALVEASGPPVDAVISTDGDSDRPLILGIDRDTAAGKDRVGFFGGDLVGMVVAESLGADAVVVPISCNDAIDLGPLRALVEPKTRIGSPYVIAGMAEARRRGRLAVCGWEANGGFLTGSDMVHDGRTLTALPTRDAFLPILAVLFSAQKKGLTLPQLFDRLPRRFSRAGLLKKFPRAVSSRIVQRFSPQDPRIKEAVFGARGITCLDENRCALASDPAIEKALRSIRCDLESFFSPALGFSGVDRLNYIDGLRIYFANGDVAHVRPSGNADELRIYSVANTQARADAIAQMGVAEPEGILRRLERAVTGVGFQ